MLKLVIPDLGCNLDLVCTELHISLMFGLAGATSSPMALFLLIQLGISITGIITLSSHRWKLDVKVTKLHYTTRPRGQVMECIW